MMKNNFTTNTVIGSLILAFAAFQYSRFVESNREPSSSDEYELHVQNLGLDPTSRLKSLEDVFLRASFGKDNTVTIGQNEHWSLNAGESRRIDVKIPIQPRWVKDDQIEFKLELIKSGFIESVLVRCATVSKSLSVYNRSYYCSVPGEQTPLLTYRLAKKGAPEPGQSLAASDNEPIKQDAKE